ncbi:hypothetical protein PCANC_03500 [Puccinia coronata f. sp. avenae]|uniref:Spc7 kinetochore protein domain-containing protein n=1 Tax=Puccinia coronata f. sp. avenae TaxID=200324 RepID=A0A2N5W0B1_9BASI|nr:hypothetical protein PCANC_03500 [Puccinia coronata f. sp. avenae]
MSSKPKKTRQSISTSTALATGTGRPTASSSNVSLPLKKRSKSLGGAHKLLIHEQRDEQELTPRKKARRSLLPGKSILKSRPTITGLVRTTSDNTLTLTQTLPSFLNEIGPASSSQPTEQSQSLPQSHQAENQHHQQDENQQQQADNSSDMDLSDDHAFHRSSLGSNTTTLLRRVSFAAKAHVRTFGSPLVDPDSSMASSTPSAQPANDSPQQPASSGVETNTNEADQTSDMSLDSSPANNPTSVETQQPTHDLINSPSQDAFKQAKASRLSMAIRGLGYNNDDDDEDEDEEDQEEDNEASSSNKQDTNIYQQSTNVNPVDMSAKAANPSSSQEEDRSQDPTPFQPIPSNIIHHTQQQHHPSRSLPDPKLVAIYSGIPRLQSLVARDQQRPISKSSRLSAVLPEYLRDNRPDETENLDDTTTTPASLSTAPAPPAVIPSSHPLSNEQDRRAWKSSRLSVALPRADDTEDVPSATLQSSSLAPAACNPTLQASGPRTLDQPRAEPNKPVEKAKSAKASRITTFLGFSQDQDESLDEQSPENLNTTNQQSNEQRDEPAAAEVAAAPAATLSKKPSRVTQLFSDWDDLSRELDNARDGASEPFPPSEDVEPTAKKHRSRISEFVQPHEDSSDVDDDDEQQQHESALIDFHDTSPPLPHAAASRPAGHRASLFKTVRPHDTRPYEDLIDIGADNTSQEPSTSHGTNIRLSVLPESSQSRLSLLPSFEPISTAAGSFPRVSLEPALPRLSSIRSSQRLSSASPSRRLSGSLSGSPQKLRFSFGSPRRSALSGRTSNPSNLNDSTRDGAVYSRSTSTDPFTSVKESDSEMNRGSQLHLPSHYSSSRELVPSRSPSILPPQPFHPSPAAPAPAPSSPRFISLNEFFEQAEIRFISLSQPSLRSYDQQDLAHASDAHPRPASLAQQIYAGMVKIPRMQLLSSTSRALRQKTEFLDVVTREHEEAIAQSGRGCRLLQQWETLRHQQQAQRQTQHPHQAPQKPGDQLAHLMNQLQLAKSRVEIVAKREALLTDIDAWNNYRAELATRTAKLSHDLDMMRKLDSVVKPSTESLRERKQNLVEEIRRRRQKISEIENCDQNLLKALKEEAKDLAAETEANRRALAESELERDLWLGKFAELEEEKREHTQRIEQMKQDPEQSEKCTVQELTRLNNEFVMLQKMMGWEMVRFEQTSLAFTFMSTMAIVFHLGPLAPGPGGRRLVSKIELRWTPPATTDSDSMIMKDPLRAAVLHFFFRHLAAHYEGKDLQGRVKEYVQEINSIWHQVRQVVWEMENVRSRFSVRFEECKEEEKMGMMELVVILLAPRTRAVAHCHFLFSGEEVLDWKAPSPLANVSCRVVCPFDTKGSIDCLNLSYILAEHMDKGHEGALKEACLEALASLDR